MDNQTDQQAQAGVEIVGLDGAEIFPSQHAIVSFRGESVERVRLENLWTDWSVTVPDADGGETTNRVSDAGEVVLEWESVQESVEPSIKIDPPTDTYAGGTYAIDVVAEGTDSATTRTATIDMDRSFDESLYVDGEAGSDDNSGTEAEPLETIQEAIDRATDYKEDGRSVSVEIAAGTYREQAKFAWGHTDDNGNHPHVLVEGDGPEATVIKGSEVFEEWQDEGNNRFSHEWTNDWGVSDDPTGGKITDCDENPDTCADSPELVLRREMVFVDGERMRQVLSADAMEPGTYFVDEAADTLSLEPPTDVTLSEATVEVAVRPWCWFTGNEANLTIRNLGVEHAASDWNGQKAAAMTLDGDEITAENVRVVDNNKHGLAPRHGTQKGETFFAKDITLRNVTLDRNGASGLAPYRVVDFLVEDSQVNENNWRGALGGYYRWSLGNKFFRAHGVTIRRTSFNNNQCQGLWFDTDIEGVLLEDVELRGNRRSNLFLEKLQGPVTLRGVVSTEAGRYAMRFANAENATIEDSRFVDNTKGGIIVRSQSERDPFDDFETGEEIKVGLGDLSVHDSVISGVNDAVRSGGSDTRGNFLIGTLLGESVWGDFFVDSYDADDNIWYESDRSEDRKAFERYGDELIDLEEWQNLTGEDQNSVWEAPTDTAEVIER